VGVGIIVPLILEVRAHNPLSTSARAAAVLVLVGGFLLRVVIVLSSEAI
jgi:formate-dependent nitrite reductase membrane component NrfD